MTQTFHAVYENGILRPVESIDLPDRCEVEVQIRTLKQAEQVPSLDEIYAILSKRFNSGEPDVAARHNEHQP